MLSGTLTVHLPGIMVPVEKTPLAKGFVSALSFEEWQEIDDAFPFADSHFAKSHPAFWTGPFTYDESREGSAMTTITELHRQIHSAFLLDPLVPRLPSPETSMRYITYFMPPEYAGVAQSSWERIIGPMEREWIVFGSEISEPYDSARLAAVQARWEILERAKQINALSPVRVALATLERTSRPDSWWGDRRGASIIEFLQCVATCESLLLDHHPADTLTHTFGLHAATLTTPSPGQITAATKQWEAVYRLRTDFIHGRRSLTGLDENFLALLPLPRRLLRDTAEAILQLSINSPCPAESLGSQLTRARQSPAEHQAFHHRLKRHVD